MTKTSSAADFLQNMRLSTPAAPQPAPETTPPLKPVPAAKKLASSRTGLKHIGGYFDLETVEKVAVLRARLRLDNSELIELAVDELYAKHLAKRAFGDA